MNCDTAFRTWDFVILILIVCIAGIFVVKVDVPAVTASNGPQDAIRLESRINQLEQRLYSMEVNVRNLDQQLRFLSNNPGLARSPRDDTPLLRAEVEAISRRVNEVACGVIKLDERTLPPTTRDSKRIDEEEPCRLNPGTPLRLAARE